MKESVVVQCSWLEDLQHSIEGPKENQGAEREGTGWADGE